MMRNPGPGKFIVLEGLDGAGTTTQCACVAHWLRRCHKDEVPSVHITREPSQGPVGAQIRSILSQRIQVDRYTLAALFAADRLDHLYEQSHGVITRLKAGEWVVMDRYYLSSFAYQAMSLDRESGELRWLWRLHEPCIIPDVTFFLDVPVAMCMQRIAIDRGLHFDLFEKQDALAAVREEYLKAMQRFISVDQNIQMVDGTASIETVTGYIQERIDKMFLDAATLSFESQQEILQKWPILKHARRATENLGLFFVTLEKFPASNSGNQEGGRGYQLVLASAERVYRVAAYIAGDGHAMTLVPQGEVDDTKVSLEKICAALHKRISSRP